MRTSQGENVNRGEVCIATPAVGVRGGRVGQKATLTTKAIKVMEKPC